MTNEEILNKAIIKALRNGWTTLSLHTDLDKKTDAELANVAGHIAKDFSTVIFSHDFAKAFWGVGESPHPGWKNWAYHLQQMVLEEDPIKYLEAFL